MQMEIIKLLLIMRLIDLLLQNLFIIQLRPGKQAKRPITTFVKR